MQDRINAMIELIDLLNYKFNNGIKGKDLVKCARIVHGDEEYDKNCTIYKLKCSHTDQELLDFINSLNFEYDSGYGGQNLFGTIWLTNGSWITRGEYDGSEWWEINSYPDIPSELSN